LTVASLWPLDGVLIPRVWLDACRILDDHDRAAGGVVDATPGAGRPAGVN